MADLEIRPAGKDDVEAMWRIARQPAIVAGTLQIPSLRLTQRQRRFDDLTDDDHLFVAERHSEILGVADLHVHDRRRRHAGDLGIAVSTAHQGKGIGTALLAALIDLADNWIGLHRLELQVYAGNAAATRLYEKHGFQVEGTLRDYAWTDGAYVDALFMARIRPAGTKVSETFVPAEGQAGMGSSDSAP
jgi:L-phenylalanine/L-methionine N-acetyltransferase